MLKTPSGGQTALAGLEKKLAGRDPDDSVIPASVRKAVRFMLGGAAMTAVICVFSVIAVLADPQAVNGGTQPTSGQLTQAIVYYIISTLVFIALWVVMARTNRSGQTWARIVATVLFVISTYNLYVGINSLHAGQTITVINIVSFILYVAVWLCGLGAVAMLWRSESSAYFKSRAAAR